jgi:cytidylate kinase
MTGKTIEKMIDEQVKKWELTRAEKKVDEQRISVFTISREPGSRGGIIAKELADNLNLDLFHQEILHEMAKSAKVSTMLLETLDEKAFSLLQDWTATLIHRNHLWPYQYLRHLMNVIGTIGKHGNAVLVGRGANFILDPESIFRIRIVAPFELRVKNVAREFGASMDEAKRRVIKTESDRKAFIRKYFHSDIASPINYDLTLNTETISTESALEAISSVLYRRNINRIT